jgi:hypothetical protein
MVVEVVDDDDVLAQAVAADMTPSTAADRTNSLMVGSSGLR